MNAPHRRGLVGLDPIAKPPVTPIERTLVYKDDTMHIAVKQTRAECVNGIDHWWLKTACGETAVVTAFAPKEGAVTCILCLVP